MVQMVLQFLFLFFGFFFLFLKSSNIIYLIYIVSLIIILIYNLKGKIFLGNSGTSLISIFISLALINNYNLGLILADEIIFLLFSWYRYD